MKDGIEQLKYGRGVPRAAALVAWALLGLCHAADAPAQWATSGSNINNTNAGNVGVGTGTPQERLHVAGRVRSDFDFLSVGGGGQQSWKDASATRAANFGLAVPGLPVTDDLHLSTYTSGGGWVGRMTILTANGNVGIGTASPNQKLGLQGMLGLYPQPWVMPSARGLFMMHDGGGGNIYAYNYPAGAPDPIGLAASTLSFSTYIGGTPYERLSVANNGNVGIGTASPNQRLGVQGMLGLYPQAWVAPSARGLFMYHTGGGGSIYAYNYPAGAADPIGVAASSISLATYIGGTPHDRLVIANGGNVGIGIPSPDAQYKLHVAGDVRVDGNISAKYQDVAEWVPSTQRLAAGTVVVVDAGGVNHVLASAAAYDTGVAGVVTAQPGLLLGEGGEGKVKVATTGRVKVRVDATRAPVRAGDLLVTSGMPGMAMRSEPVSFGGVAMHRPGTIIGKALEPLAKGTGEILVLLSLQ
jgi:hypothetical protein